MRDILDDRIGAGGDQIGRRVITPGDADGTRSSGLRHLHVVDAVAN
jgi:hypothetical protein